MLRSFRTTPCSNCERPCSDRVNLKAMWKYDPFSCRPAILYLQQTNTTPAHSSGNPSLSMMNEPLGQHLYYTHLSLTRGRGTVLVTTTDPARLIEMTSPKQVVKDGRGRWWFGNSVTSTANRIITPIH
ncbi:hypothetical protein BaRGS_00023482 [Batillaria attramentaria]|uniref:Uncharacterized protein n=1 Tax=Batillaria attramentaria TaxID=370345 RepID=A0ABD0KDL4_9CAEN